MENRKEKMYRNIRIIRLEHVINGMWPTICSLDPHLSMSDCTDLGFLSGELGLMRISPFDTFQSTNIFL